MKKVNTVFVLILVITLLVGCRSLADKSHSKKTFANNIASAESYLLLQLEEKYGEKFEIVGEGDLTDYPLHGAVYSNDVAPISDSTKIAQALVDQSSKGQVRDNFAKYYFADQAVEPVIQLCENTTDITAYRVKLMAAATEKAWTPEDDFITYISENEVYVDIYVQLVVDKTDDEYAEMLLEMLQSLYDFETNITLKVVNDKRYIFFQDIAVLGSEPTPHFTLNDVKKAMDTVRDIRFKQQNDLVIKSVW